MKGRQSLNQRHRMYDICTELRRVYHLEDVDASHPIRRAVDEIRRLRATLDAAERELSDVRAALGPAAAPRVRMVGCDGADGLLRIHPESETCEVCAPIRFPPDDMGTPT